MRGDPPKVMRVSRKALSILGLLAAAAIGGSLLYALQPAAGQATSELYNTTSHTTTDSLAAAPKDYAQIPSLGHRCRAISAARSLPPSSAASTGRS
jgi:hypothetical protein